MLLWLANKYKKKSFLTYKHIFTLGLLSSTLMACASQYVEPMNGASLGEFRPLVQHIRDYAPCRWESQGQVGNRVQYDYGCHGGAWNTSTLLVNQSQQKVDEIRVLWRERPNMPTTVEERRIAEEFLLATLRYATPNAIDTIAPEFFKNTNKRIMYGPLKVVLSTENQAGGERLHRIAITDTRSLMDRPTYHRPAKLPSKTPLGMYERPVEQTHDPYAQKAVEAAPVTQPVSSANTARAIEASRQTVQDVEKQVPMQSAQPAAPVLAPAPRQRVEPVYVPEPTPVPEEIIPTENVRIEPRIESPTPAEREVLKTVEPYTAPAPASTSAPQSREERLQEIMRSAAGESEKAVEAAPAPATNYISREENYLRDVENEVYRQMKSQYESDKGASGSTWGDLKELRESLEITDFNLPDEGGL